MEDSYPTSYINVFAHPFIIMHGVTMLPSPPHRLAFISL